MANTWNQANTTWSQNTWGQQADVTLTLSGLSAATAVGSLTELIEVKPGWGTLDWGENGWGSVESAQYTLTSTTPVLSTDTACCLFASTSWGSTASFTARGCLIYNSTNSNKAVCAINFGADKTVTSGTFTIEFPAQTAGNAIIQIA